jgi:hypothetical protein
MFGFASKEDILKTVKAPNTILLDVRSPPEIEATGPFQIGDNPWFTTSCTPAECPDLEFLAKEMFPDKSGRLLHFYSVKHHVECKLDDLLTHLHVMFLLLLNILQLRLSSTADLENEHPRLRRC